MQDTGSELASPTPPRGPLSAGFALSTPRPRCPTSFRLWACEVERRAGGRGVSQEARFPLCVGVTGPLAAAYFQLMSAVFFRVAGHVRPPSPARYRDLARLHAAGKPSQHDASPDRSPRPSRSVAVDPHRLDQDQRAALLHHDSVVFRPVVMVAAGRYERLTQQKS